MQIALIILGIIFLLVGLIGSILPALPGPPLAFGGVLLLLLVDSAQIEMANNSYTWLIILGIITLLITVLDYFMPIWGAKRFGGTNAGTRGSTIGLIVAVILTFITSGLGALLILAGPFVGAYLGEKNAGQTKEVALRSAKGSFLGFMAGTFVKVTVVLAIAVYFAILLI